MILTVKNYLSEQSKMLRDFEEYIPQMDKIEKANEVGEKLLSHINRSVAKLDEEAFHNIDVDSIKNNLNIKTNEKIDEECLLGIYKEIEDSFNLQGRVSLSEYLYQGNVLYTGMMNDLTGNVDYSINYSEEQLKKREKEAAIRYHMLLAFNGIAENMQNIEFSPEGALMVNKYVDYLNAVEFNRNKEILSINDKIAEVGYMLLAMETFNDLGCNIKNPIELNQYVSDKMKDILPEFAEYSEDLNVLKDFSSLSNITKRLCENDSSFSDIYQEAYRKVQITEEAVFDRQKEQNIAFGE